MEFFPRGTENLGTGLDHDRGYLYQPNVNTGNNPSLLQYCEDNDILPLYRASTGEMAFIYDPATDLLEQIQHNQDITMAANGGRLATYLRTGSEQAHLCKHQYKYFTHQAHNSRTNAIGIDKINSYNVRYNGQLGAEFAEMPKINAEYLVMVGLYNRWHAKFAR